MPRRLTMYSRYMASLGQTQNLCLHSGAMWIDTHAVADICLPVDNHDCTESMLEGVREARLVAT